MSFTFYIPLWEGIVLFQIFKEHRGFGKQILLLAKNELIKTYKGAVIGPFWAVIKPAFTLFVYWFAFSVGIRSAGDVEVFINGEYVDTFQRFTFMLVGFIPFGNLYLFEFWVCNVPTNFRFLHLWAKSGFF